MIFIFLLLFILFEIIYEIEIFLFNFIILQSFYLSDLIFILNKLKKKLKLLINYFSNHFTRHSQIIKYIFEFIFHDIIKHKKKLFNFSKIHFLQQSLSKKRRTNDIEILDFFTKNNKTKKEVLLMIETNVGLVFMMRLKSEISGSCPSRLMVMLASSYMSRKDKCNWLPLPWKFRRRILAPNRHGFWCQCWVLYFAYIIIFTCPDFCPALRI